MNYAGFWVRFAAHLIDFVLLNAVELAIEYGISLPLGLSAFSQQCLGVVLAFILAYFYYVEFPLKRGTTFGKRVFGILVVDRTTGALFTRKQAIIRLLGYIPSYALIGCGFLMVAFQPEKRGLHDLIAGTICIRRKNTVPVEAKESMQIAGVAASAIEAAGPIS